MAAGDGFLIAGKEKGLVAPPVEARNLHGSTYGAAKLISLETGLRPARAVGEEVIRVQLAVPQKVISRPVELVRA